MVYRFYCMALFYSQMRRHMIRYIKTLIETTRLYFHMCSSYNCLQDINMRSTCHQNGALRLLDIHNKVLISKSTFQALDFNFESNCIVHILFSLHGTNHQQQRNEPQHGISKNVICACSKGSEPACIRAV